MIFICDVDEVINVYIHMTRTVSTVCMDTTLQQAYVAYTIRCSKRMLRTFRNNYAASGVQPAVYTEHLFPGTRG